MGYGTGSRISSSVAVRAAFSFERAFTGSRWPPGSAHMQPFSVVASSIANQNPVDARRVGPQVGVIGVADDLAADARLLEDVHGLQEQRLGHADVFRDGRELRSAAECVEDGIEVVHRVAELVEREMRLAAQAAFAVESILLEEAADRLAARQEVTLGRVARAAVRGEDRRLVRRRHVLAREQERALAKREASRCIREVGQHEEAVLPVSRLLSRRKISAHDDPAPPRLARV